MSDITKKKGPQTVNKQGEAQSKVSKVNPNQTLRALKDKSLFMLMIVVIGAISLSMIFSGTSKADDREDSRENKSIVTKDVLSKNLALIEQMKKNAQYQSPVQKVEPQNHQKDKKVPKSKESRPILSSFLLRSEPSTPALTKEVVARMNAPTTFVNTGAKKQFKNQGETQANQGATFAGDGANTQFVNQKSTIATVSATKLEHPDFTVPAGEFIPATMEVAMNSELPGMISAVVERNIYSLTGQKVLIPRGSKLQGQYNSGVIQGQSRFLVVWNRVRLPNGVVATLNSPGSDSLGRSGLNADSVDRHFMERFGTATLLSVLGAATANVGVDSQTQFNSATQYRSAIADSLNKTASQTLEQDMQIKPTLSKYQGVEVNVFVAHDLDFYNVGSQELSTPTKIRPRVWK